MKSGNGWWGFWYGLVDPFLFEGVYVRRVLMYERDEKQNETIGSRFTDEREHADSR